MANDDWPDSHPNSTSLEDLEKRFNDVDKELAAMERRLENIKELLWVIAAGLLFVLWKLW